MSLLKKIVLLFIGISTSSLCYADFYVIPVTRKIKNVVTVAKSGAQFTDVKAAIGSITDASETNRYLVYVGPGVYTVREPIVLKAWVTLKGSGEQATLLKGSVSTADISTSAIVVGADNAALSELSVENTGGSGTLSVGVHNDACSPTMTNVTVTASGYQCYAIYNYDASPAMTNITVTVTSPDVSGRAHGVTNRYGRPVMTRVMIIASGRNTVYGVHNDRSSPTMSEFTIKTAGFGDYANSRGVYNQYESCDPNMTNVTISCVGGLENYGVYNRFGASPTLNGATITVSGGQSRNEGVHNEDNYNNPYCYPKIYFSRITADLAVYAGLGISTCVYCIGSGDAMLGSNCQ